MERRRGHFTADAFGLTRSLRHTQGVTAPHRPIARLTAAGRQRVSIAHGNDKAQKNRKNHVGSFRLGAGLHHPNGEGDGARKHRGQPCSKKELETRGRRVFIWALEQTGSNEADNTCEEQGGGDDDKAPGDKVEQHEFLFCGELFVW